MLIVAKDSRSNSMKKIVKQPKNKQEIAKKEMR